MKIKQIYPLFIALGAGILGGLLITNIKADTNFYRKYVVEPTEVIEYKIMPINEERQKKILLKTNYKKWVSENIELIKSIKTSDPALQSQIDALPLVIKDGSSIISKFREFLLTGEDNKLEERGEFVNLKINEKESKYKLNIGLNFMLSTTAFLQDIKKVFKNDERVTFDYIFFHEFAHFLSYNYGEQSNVNEILRQFELQQQSKDVNEIIHTEEDKRIIDIQYVESVADVLAVQLLYLKYPKLIKDRNLAYGIGKARYKEGEPTHLTTVALLSLNENMKDKHFKLPSTIEGLLDNARKEALVGTQYYSTVSFANEDDDSETRRKEVILNRFDFNRNKYEKLVSALDREVEIEEEKYIKMKRK